MLCARTTQEAASHGNSSGCFSFVAAGAAALSCLRWICKLPMCTSRPRGVLVIDPSGGGSNPRGASFGGQHPDVLFISRDMVLAAHVKQRMHHADIWPRGPMDKASAYGAGDCRFESCRGHFIHENQNSRGINTPERRNRTPACLHAP